jgi:hypothetical protein
MKQKQSTFLALVLFVMLLTGSQLFSQNVSITNDGSAADASAMLDVKSTSKGILVPRMTTSQRDQISSPATGLLIYQTDGEPGFYEYNGTSWVQLLSNQLSQGRLYIGDMDGIATGRTVTGDVEISVLGTTSIGYFKVTNDMLSGSITSDKLAGGIYNDQLAGSITNDKLAGSITYDKLAGSIPSEYLVHGNYMITSSGSNGQVWTSDGNGAGVWAASQRTTSSSDIVPELTKAIQEQQATIKDQQTAIKTLQKQMDELYKMIKDLQKN